LLLAEGASREGQAGARQCAGAAPAKAPLSGDFEVADLLTRDGWCAERFHQLGFTPISGLRLQQAPDRLSIERILARKPYGRIVIAAMAS